MFGAKFLHRFSCFPSRTQIRVWVPTVGAKGISKGLNVVWGVCHQEVILSEELRVLGLTGLEEGTPVFLSVPQGPWNQCGAQGQTQGHISAPFMKSFWLFRAAPHPGPAWEGNDISTTKGMQADFGQALPGRGKWWASSLPACRCPWGPTCPYRWVSAWGGGWSGPSTLPSRAGCPWCFHVWPNAFQLSPRSLLSLACLCPCHFSQPNAASHSLLQAQGLGQVSGHSSMPRRLKEGWAKELSGGEAHRHSGDRQKEVLVGDFNKNILKCTWFF